MKKGFTVIEILITISIFAILLTIGIISYTALSDRMSIDVTTNEIISVLNLAQSKTLSSEDASNYGVYFATGSYVLFRGIVYNPLDLDNEVFDITSKVEIFDIDLDGGGDEVVFDRVTGTTDYFGIIKLRLISDASETRDISIYAFGQISQTGSVNPVGSRVVDSRHLHLELGWSIQGATTLSLGFMDSPNPDVLENITMADFFDGGFDWSGTINVNGATETLRLHTHYLDAFDTSFCIHRDRRYNEKALVVSIDSKELVTYSAVGTPTVGLFGGTLELQ